MNNFNSKLYAIYANQEHIHILVSRSPDISETKLATIIADSSQKFINENKLVLGHFEWQQVGSAFSVSKSDLNKVCKYILNQDEHHRNITFKDEYESFMKHYQQTLKN